MACRAGSNYRVAGSVRAHRGGVSLPAIAEIQLQPHAGESEVSTDERIGKMQRREIQVARGHILPTADQKPPRREYEIQPSHFIDRRHRQAEALLFGNRQTACHVDSAGTVPNVHLTSIAVDGARIKRYKRFCSSSNSGCANDPVRRITRVYPQQGTTDDLRP